MQWDPQQYARFERERSAPFQDAVALIERRPNLRVIDLGCGTGALTSELATLLPHSTVLGIDSSADMLAQAAQYQQPTLVFAHQSIESVKGSWDVVFSHAAIQWIADHPRLLAHLWSLVAPGGQLVVQLPSNHGHISHTLMHELATIEPFRSALHGWVREVPVLAVDTYARLLWQLGAQNIIIFEKVYPHVFAHAEQIVEWVKGTALRPYLQRLSPALQAEFLRQYREQLHTALPGSPVFYGFRRILWSVWKAEDS